MSVLQGNRGAWRREEGREARQGGVGLGIDVGQKLRDGIAVRAQDPSAGMQRWRREARGGARDASPFFSGSPPHSACWTPSPPPPLASLLPSPLQEYAVAVYRLPLLISPRPDSDDSRSVCPSLVILLLLPVSHRDLHFLQEPSLLS